MLAILLAAGKGQRMGQPKALLQLGELTATELCLKSLALAGIEHTRVVVSSKIAREVEAILETSKQRVPASDSAKGLAGSWELVINEEAERGQTSSLQRGLEGVEQDFLLHTVDHPLVDVTVMKCLLEAWVSRPEGTDILAPSVAGRRGHPCLHHAALVAEFLALPQGAPAHAVIRSDPTRVGHVVLEDPWITRDIDVPGDLDEALQELARRAQVREQE